MAGDEVACWAVACAAATRGPAEGRPPVRIAAPVLPFYIARAYVLWCIVTRLFAWDRRAAARWSGGAGALKACLGLALLCMLVAAPAADVPCATQCEHVGIVERGA